MKNHLRARFCNDCGSPLSADRSPTDGDGRSKLHADIAHPISAPARESIQRRILASFAEEIERSKQPGYKPVEIYEASEGFDPE
jgi:stage V sporulation protein G